MKFHEISVITYQARKEFICTWCNEKIRIREKYDRVTACLDKKLVSGVFHQDCRMVMVEAKVFKYEQNDRKKNRNQGITGQDEKLIA